MFEDVVIIWKSIPIFNSWSWIWNQFYTPSPFVKLATHTFERVDTTDCLTFVPREKFRSYLTRKQPRFKPIQKKQPPSVIMQPFLVDKLYSIVNNNERVIIDFSTLQSNSSITNNTSTPTSFFQTYQILVTALNAPFVVIFLLIFLIALVTYFLRRKSLKKNQHILFIMLFALQLATLLNLATRIVSELSYLESDKILADSTFLAIKAIDRCCVFVVVYIEILILAFICRVL